MRTRYLRAAVAALLIVLGQTAWSSADPSGPIPCQPKDGYVGSIDGLRFTSDRNGTAGVYQLDPEHPGAAYELTADSAPDYEPSAQRLAGLMAYVSERDGNPEIYCSNVGIGPVDLTQNPAIDSNPSMTADGSWIAFQSNRSGNFDIWVMNNDGTGLEQVTSDPADDIEPAFSPDGKKIAFVSDMSGNNDVYVIDAYGSGPPVDITNNPADDENPSFSKDGSLIAFNSDRSGHQEIYTVPVTGGTPTQVTNDPSSNTEPSFSPDGSQIAFTSDRTGNNDIWITNADGSGTPVDVTNNPANDMNPDWQAAFPPLYPPPPERIELTMRVHRHAATRTLVFTGSLHAQLTSPSGRKCRLGPHQVVKLFKSRYANGLTAGVASTRTGPGGGYLFLRRPLGTFWWHVEVRLHCGGTIVHTSSRSARVRGFGPKR